MQVDSIIALVILAIGVVGMVIIYAIGVFYISYVHVKRIMSKIDEEDIENKK